jgi:guanylate kinase
MQKGNLIVVSGPSAAGKGTICKKLLDAYRDIVYSVSATTRQPREGEVNGVNYWFTTKEDFCKMIEDGKLLEWAEVYGNYYGTPLDKVQATLAEGKDVLLEIDTQGAMNVKKKFPEGVYIFILPPSLADLKRRIEKRGTETFAVMEKRLAAAGKEILMASEYDYVIVNDVVDDAVERLIAVLKAEKLRSARCVNLINNIAKG